MPDRAAIVTGASSGIGLAIARMLGQEGFAMTLAARRPEKLHAAADGLAAEGFELQAVPGNVSDEADIQRVVSSHRDRYGRLDVLVNNAGVGVGAPVGEILTKRLDLQLDVNLRSIVLFYREALELLRSAAAEHRNVLVVNTSSISGKRGEAWLSVYSAAKHAVVGWTEAMNKELSAEGIKFDCALPRVRRHRDDRLRQGACQARGHDPAGGHRRGGALPAEGLSRLRRPRDHVRAPGRGPVTPSRRDGQSLGTAPAL